MDFDTSRVELISPLGRVLYALVDRDNRIGDARRAAETATDDAEWWLALGGVQSSLFRFHDAVASFGRAVELAPDDHRAWRMRGHRLLTLRHVRLARRDLERAVSLAPDNWDALYHLGIARYLDRDHSAAADAFARAANAAEGVQVLLTADWRYVTHRRLGDAAAAMAALEPIGPDFASGPNPSNLHRVLVFKGLRPAETLLDPIADERADLQMLMQAEGLATFYLLEGARDRALPILRDIVARDWWPSFGTIVAEAALLDLDGVG